MEMRQSSRRQSSKWRKQTSPLHSPLPQQLFHSPLPQQLSNSPLPQQLPHIAIIRMTQAPPQRKLGKLGKPGKDVDTGEIVKAGHNPFDMPLNTSVRNWPLLRPRHHSSSIPSFSSSSSHPLLSLSLIQSLHVITCLVADTWNYLLQPLFAYNPRSAFVSIARARMPLSE
jgi:hypothetical protein